MTKQITHGQAVQMVQANFDYAQKTIDKFAVRYAADPCHAFEWAEDAMDAASTRRVTGEILHMLNASDDLDDVKQWVRKEANRLAGRVSSSTSVCSNRMEQYTSACWVSMAVLLETGQSW